MEKKRNGYAANVRSKMAGFWAGAFESRGKAGAAEFLVSFLLGTMLSRTTVFGSSAPFGMSAVAAFSGRTSLFTATLGAIIGFVTVGERVNLFKCLLGLAFFVSSSLILKRVMHVENRSLSAVLAGAGYLTAEIAAVVTGNGVGVARSLSEVLLAGCATAVFKTALFYREKTVGAISLYGMILAALASVNGVELLGGRLSLGHAVAMFFTICTAQNAGMYAAAAIGMLSGIVFDITASVMPVYTAALGCGGLVSGILRRRSKASSSVLFLMMSSAMAMLVGGAGSFVCVLLEGVAASLGCLFANNDRYVKIGRLFGDITGENKEKRIKNYMKSRLSGLADAYERLACELEPEPQKRRAETEESRRIYKRAMECVCNSCPERKRCYSVQGETSEQLTSVGNRVLRRGYSMKEDFTEVCSRPEVLAAYVNLGVCELRNEVCRRNELEESRRMLGNQYEQISKVLDTSAEKLDSELHFCDEYEGAVAMYLSNNGSPCDVLAYYDSCELLRIEICCKSGDRCPKEELLRSEISRLTGHTMGAPEVVKGRAVTCISFRELPKFECAVGAAAEKRYPKGNSGDRGTYFYGEDGRLYIILCDGMGSGEGAAALAVKMIKYMQCFLKTGADAESAADIVNTAMLLKNEHEAFSTADIAVVDPATGDLVIVKCGAEESYVRKKDRVLRLGNPSARSCVDIEEMLRPQVFNGRLEEGDMLVMGSDGVFCGSGSEIEDYLLKIHSDDPKELSSILLKMTRLDVGNDDRTVIAVSYRKRK